MGIQTGPTPVTIYQTDPVVLNNEQIKALPSSAIAIRDGIEDSIIAPICAWWYLDWHGDYDNLNAAAAINISYTGTFTSPLGTFSGVQLSSLLQDGASHVAFMGLKGFNSTVLFPSETLGIGQFQDEPGVIGAGLEIAAGNGGAGDFTMGHADNKLYCVVWYGITDFGIT